MCTWIGIAWMYCKNGWYKDSRKFTGSKPCGEGKNGRSRLGGCLMLNCICLEGSQDQTSRAIVLKKKKKSMK
jgi:hypothetical protein